ncbi:MAG: hypothetical protein QXI32_04850 [Candidatus Bathyarchaeia archaeon]
MSQSESESSIVNSFKDLLNYVTILGEHVNQIYDHLEKMEADIDRVKNDLGSSIAENRKELESVKKSMITKAEFSDTLQKLNQPFEKFKPKAVERPRKTRTPPQTDQEKKKSQ